MPKVIVIGGGPGGSTAAALLAQSGVPVKVLERAEFPRYHIGESITTSCRAILDYVGALDKINSCGFTSKTGVLMRWGQEKDWVIDWTAQFGTDVRSWQVDREDFDTVLLDHAGESGAEVVQNAQVKRVIFDGDRAVGVEWQPAGGELRVETADYVIDASGRAGLIAAQHFNHRRPHEIFRNVAIWGYWENAELLPGSPSGGINVISSPDGWYWLIPLRGNRFSVGFVTHKTNFVERRREFDSPEAMLKAMMAESPTMKQVLANATYQPGVHVEQDFSYAADDFCGNGYFLVGDAACFLDPLLSTGVHLAMYSGMLSAASILALNRGEVNEQEAQAFFESLYRNAYHRLFTLVISFYQQHAGKDRYFALADTLSRAREDGTKSPDLAFGEIIAGLTDLREAADRAGQGAQPIKEVIDAAATGGVKPVQELLSAAEQARLRAEDAAPNQRVTMAPMYIDANDLYDAASGLYLVTEPRLGISRASSDETVTAG
ncbi:NAD(P)/FAD-dependent oxidoreductase [Micromonospora eburnea]|uniref:Dehydrogenase (Flavoprotein) n=2 Tax=Micromonospora eburnea TaxID=227316 RepID=A0A1C6UZ26_9ACTN|nr:NAD(P)/FAD-dependent oxidoreductase [Micromonospora eburnea]SCL59325.1 Dehydrogenase (flavoprotein) [Micromonospora eburnea]